MKHIVLGHLSKENNYAKLAYETVKLEVTLGDNPYKGEELEYGSRKPRQCIRDPYVLQNIDMCRRINR